jgi:hypothetical protein
MALVDDNRDARLMPDSSFMELAEDYYDAAVRLCGAAPSGTNVDRVIRPSCTCTGIL